MNKRVEIVSEKEMKVVEVPIPKPPPKGVVVKIHYAGVCHSDVHLWVNKYKLADDNVIPFSEACPKYQFPRVLGHEIAGEVYAIGDADCKGAPKLSKGDLVLVYPWTGCGTCGSCTKRRENLCADSANNAYGIGKDGGYQAYCSVDLRTQVQKLPKDFPMDVACQVTCSALTAYNGNRAALRAVEQAHHLRGVARCLIVGAGGLGLWALKWAKALYPKNTLIFVADIAQDKIDNAVKAGADGGVVWERGLSAEEIKKRTLSTLGGQIDAAFDYVNSGITAGFIQDSMARGGCHVPTGLVGGTYKLGMCSMPMDMREIHGVYVGSSQQMEEVANYVAKKKVVAPPVTVHKPEEAGELLQQLLDAKLTGRAVLKFI